MTKAQEQVKKLGRIGVFVYESASQEGRFGFTRCDADDYESHDKALHAAWRKNHEAITDLDAESSVSPDLPTELES